MPRDNFGRILPPPERFHALPAAMKAECLALMAERAREMGSRRRTDLIESRMCLYAGAKPYRLPDVAMAPPPRWIGRDTVWTMTGYTTEEIRRIDRIAAAIVAGYWPHCYVRVLRPRTIRMLAYVAEMMPSRDAAIYPYDLAEAFAVEEPHVRRAFADCERAGFLVRRDEHAWLITSPASRAEGAPAGRGEGRDGGPVLRFAEEVLRK